MLAPPKTIFLIRQMLFELRVDFAKSEGYVVNQRDLDKKRLTAVEMCKTVKSSTFGITKGYYDTLGSVIQQPYINQCSLLFGGRYKNYYKAERRWRRAASKYNK
jgi:hypothetical protein